MKTIKTTIEKILLGSIALSCLINAVWLILIPGENIGSVFFISIKRIALLGLILLPLLAWVASITSHGRKLFRKYEKNLTQAGRIFSWVFLPAAILYFIEPAARFRLQFSPAIWLRLLPVVSNTTWMILIWIGLVSISRRPESETNKNQANREIFIDFTRGIAILLAVGSHIFYAFGYAQIFGNADVWVKALTRLATPTFVLITGMMFEMVYYQRIQKSGFRSASRSLVLRAWQCYLAFGAAVFVEWFNQHLSNKNALLAMVFLSKSLFSEILLFYVLFLLLGISILALRHKFGIKTVVILPMLVWVGNLFLNLVHWPAKDTPISNLTALLFGKPAISNFSVWHALTFMAFGMLLGYFLKQKQPAQTKSRFQLVLLGLLALNIVVTLISVHPMPWRELLFHFSNDYRSNHSIVYYSMGSSGALILVWLFWRIRTKLDQPLLNSTILPLGLNSLLAFAIGNSLSALFPSIDAHPFNVLRFILIVIGGTIILIHLNNQLVSLAR